MDKSLEEKLAIIRQALASDEGTSDVPETNLPEEETEVPEQAADTPEERTDTPPAPQAVVTETRTQVSETTRDCPETSDIRNKPFPFALYPILAAQVAIVAIGTAALIEDCGADDTAMGDADTTMGADNTPDKGHVVNHAGTIESHTEDFVKSHEIDYFIKQHKSVWLEMKKETSPKAAERDAFAALDAILEKDEATLLEFTKKYTKVDFLPAYLVRANAPGVKEMVKYAKVKGPEKAISKLMEEKSEKDDGKSKKADIWPYRAGLLKDMDKKAEYRKKISQEVWDSCPISQNPDRFTELPDTGSISKRAVTRLEDPSTAGPLKAVKGLDGEPFLTAYGQVCRMREKYAKELEAANQCVFDKTGKEIVPRYCYRSAQLQAVVRSNIKEPPLHKCGKNEKATTLDKIFGFFTKVKSKVSGKGNAPALPPGMSIHQMGEAVDLDDTPKNILASCLPPYWKELEGDPGHWDMSHVPRPKEGNCTTVELRDGKSRPFCFYTEKKEEDKEAPKEETKKADELPPEGTYERVPKGELSRDDLVPAKATPEIVKMSKKIEKKESRHISLQDVMDGGWYVFRYQANGKETFCKIEAHNNHKLREFGRFLRGHKSFGTALRNKGCSNYWRK